MHILILGGTGWLGATVAQLALADGHAVTCLARGKSGAVPAGATLVQADRKADDAYAGVTGNHWDVVVDIASQPGQVRAAADALAPRCGHCIFVSSASVYASHQTPHEDEDAPLLAPLAADAMADMGEYGAAKAACEQHVRAAFGDHRSLIVRPGLIGGPGDRSDRTGYWPSRFARARVTGQPVLVPEPATGATQVIDVRDLARWIVDGAVRSATGIFNAVGPVVPLADHLAVAREVAGHDGAVVAAPTDWLTAQGVAPWAGPKSLPLWLPMADYAGFGARDGQRAVAAGLSLRPLAQTLADTLAWEHTRAADTPRRAGLTDEEEAALRLALRG